MSNNTIKELIQVYNGLVSKEKQITSWKKKKSGLLSLINSLRSSKTVKSIVEPLLQEVVSEDKDGRKVGLPYSAILAMVLEELPNAKTTIKCLAWYQAQLNKVIKLPIRPRSQHI